ncbi:hypothetical protein CHCC20335_3326 [Bacillus paralicheniformis]|nr:hypothetical protein CHCC20335_3326 [Bacillus paralicheniformis]
MWNEKEYIKIESPLIPSWALFLSFGLFVLINKIHFHG